MGNNVSQANQIVENTEASLWQDIKKRTLKQYPKLSETVLTESMIITDNSKIDNPILYVNDSFEKLTLYPREYIVNRNCRFLQGEGTDQEVVQEVRNAIKNGKSLKVQILNYRRDGKPFWNKFEMLPLRGPHPSKPNEQIVTHFVAVQKDITSKKQQSTHPTTWNNKQVINWLRFVELDNLVKVFKEKKIAGTELEIMARDASMAQQMVNIDAAQAKRVSTEIQSLLDTMEVKNSDVAFKFYVRNTIFVTVLKRSELTVDNLHAAIAKNFSTNMQGYAYAMSLVPQYATLTAGSGSMAGDGASSSSDNQHWINTDQDLLNAVANITGQRTLKIYLHVQTTEGQGNPLKETFFSMINHKEGRQALRQHLKTEYNEELLDFVEQVDEYNKAFPRALQDKFEQIFAQFVPEESEFCLNLPSPIRQKLFQIHNEILKSREKGVGVVDGSNPQVQKDLDEAAVEKLRGAFVDANEHICNLLSYEPLKRFLAKNNAL